MSTKAEVIFTDHTGMPCAAVYVHNGLNAAEELRDFFRAVVDASDGSGPHGLRFHDPCYLAARYVAWLTGGSLAATGCGVIIPGSHHVHRWITVECHERPSGVFPRVTEEKR